MIEKTLRNNIFKYPFNNFLNKSYLKIIVAKRDQMTHRYGKIFVTRCNVTISFFVHSVYNRLR